MFFNLNIILKKTFRLKIFYDQLVDILLQNNFNVITKQI